VSTNLRRTVRVANRRLRHDGEVGSIDQFIELHVCGYLDAFLISPARTSSSNGVDLCVPEARMSGAVTRSPQQCPHGASHLHSPSKFFDVVVQYRHRWKTCDQEPGCDLAGPPEANFGPEVCTVVPVILRRSVREAAGAISQSPQSSSGEPYVMLDLHGSRSAVAWHGP
jgi:hypothetical protein